MKFIFLCLIASVMASDDPLPSWNEGKAKSAILEFIEAAASIPPDGRIAVFDQDGTLWVEQPIYTQFQFAIDKAGADKQSIQKLSFKEIEKMIAVTHSGMTVEAFHAEVKAWLMTAVHPRFKKPYTALVYQPMLEVIDLFRNNGFKTYIVSGGGQEFIRVFADKVYGIPVENVIGSVGKVKFEMKDGKPVLMKQPEILFVDDFAGKPEAIYMIIGKRPVAAFGNSDGDRQMLEWTQGGAGKRFELLVHHDDAEREYAYGPDSRVGTFSESLMDEAIQKGWIVVSMKNDWKVIFP